jgi:hypothetical protein
MKKIVGALFALLLLATPAAAQEKTDWGMGAAYVAAGTIAIMDIGTTERAAALGLQEKNPLYKPFVSKPGMVGLVNGTITGTVALLNHHFLFKKGKKKEAKIVMWTWNIARAAIVANNIRQINKR